MNKSKIAFCLLLSAFCFSPVFAQKSKPKPEPERKLVFNIKDSQEPQMLLAVVFRDKHLLKDSAFNNGKGAFIFEGDIKYDDGMYTLVAASTKRPILNFIIDGNQKFTYNLDTAENVNNYSVTGSPENAEMLLFQQKTTTAQKNMKEWDKKRVEFDKSGKKDSAEYYMELMKNIHSGMETFISELIDRNPTFLFSKLQKSYREIEIPDPPVYDEGTIDSLFQIIYFRTHFWDNFDLTDRRFLFLPSYEPKLNNYFKRVLWFQEVDTINKYMDLMLQKTNPDSLMYRFLIEYLSKEFQDNKMVGHDAIFVHLVKNNILAGKCIWMDEDLIKQYRMRVEDWEPLLIGTKSVEMILLDTTQTKWISSYNMPKKYRVLWFYDHNCHTCKKEAAEMKAVMDSLEKIDKLNFDVYAVNKTEDMERWKKYIRENGFTWINVGGTTGNVDWTKAYRITSNPQFFIIDQDKKIILNKNISKDSIPKFLEDHERIEVEKARLKNRKR
jgi:peroxiredoxin